MRSRPVLIAALTAVALGAGQTALSPVLGQVAVRPARNADLPGTWVMLNLIAEKADREDSMFAPHQIFHFDPSGRMKFMTSVKPFPNLALFEAAPLVTRYSLDKRGMLLLSNPGWEAARKYQCVVVLKGPGGADPTVARTGDLLLTAVDEAGKPLWSKLLRKAQ